MKKIKNRLVCLMVLAFLHSCGGGPSSPPLGPPVISGVGSIGAPMGSANITLKSLQTGGQFSPGTTDSDGKFSFNVDTAVYPPPYFIRLTSELGDKTISQFSYISGAGGAGIVVSPISSAAIALAANRTADAAFSNQISISKNDFDAKAEILYKAAKNILVSVGVTNSSQLITNSGYNANGTGADSFFDIVKFNYDGTLSGDLVLTTKFSGKAIKLTNLSTIQSVESLGSIGSLSSKIVGLINTNIQCLATGFEQNNSSKLDECLDDSFKDSSISTSTGLLTLWSNLVGQSLLTKAADVKWCDFDDSSLTFESESSSLGGASGICSAVNEFKAGGSSFIFPGRYRFTVNANGDGIVSLKLYGNQLPASISVFPKLQKKIRTDGLTTNIGITSGYKINIGTGVDLPSNGDGANLVSARVRLKNYLGSSLNGGTFYLQCRQGNAANCTDSFLSLCSDSNCDSFSLKSDGIFSVSALLAEEIIEEMKSGRVSAEITTYSDTNRTAQVYQSTIALVSLPIGQNIANGITFASLSTSSQSALSLWSSNNSLSIDYSSGDVNLYKGIFYANKGDAQVDSKVKLSSGSATHSSLDVSEVMGLKSDCSVSGVYRAYTLMGSFNNVKTETKYYGSCDSSDY